MYAQLKEIVALNSASPRAPAAHVLPAAALADTRLSAVCAEAWHCRVPISPDGPHYVPFVLPLWGVVEGDHLHMDNHVNFVLHADAGKIVAAAAYPVRDRFQFTKPGVVVSLHGPVRWFDKGTFVALGGGSSGGGSTSAGAGAAAGASATGAHGVHGCAPVMALAWCGASATLVRVRLPSRCARTRVCVQACAALTRASAPPYVPSHSRWQLRRCFTSDG